MVSSRGSEKELGGVDEDGDGDQKERLRGRGGGGKGWVE